MSALMWPGQGLDYDRLPERFNIVSLLVDRHVAEGRGEEPAILTPARTVSCATLAASVPRAASILTALGVQGEQRVVLLLADSPEFAYAFLGAQKAGCVPVPLSTVGTAGPNGGVGDDQLQCRQSHVHRNLHAQQHASGRQRSVFGSGACGVQLHRA